MKHNRIAGSIIILVFSFLISSCNRYEYKSNSAFADYSYIDTILYDMDKTESVIIDRLVDSYSIIKLETGTDFLIGHVDELLYVDGKFVVVDRSIAHSVFVFDNTGKFKNKISALGNGPKEYLSINDVCVSPEGNIVIVDNVKGRMMSFTVDGELTGTTSLYFKPYRTEFLSDDEMIFNVACNTTSEDKQINASEVFISNKKLKGIKYFGEDMLFKTKNSNYTLTRSKGLYRYGDSVYFTLNSDNNIYQVKDDSIYAKYHLMLAPEDLIPFWDENTNKRKDYFDWHLAQPSFNGDFMELADYTLLRYAYNRYVTPILIYDHKSKRTFVLDEYADPLFYFFNIPDALIGNNCVAVCQNASFVKSRQNMALESGNELLIEACKDLSVDSNPVLFIYNFNFEIVNENR